MPNAKATKRKARAAPAAQKPARTVRVKRGENPSRSWTAKNKKKEKDDDLASMADTFAATMAAEFALHDQRVERSVPAELARHRETVAALLSAEPATEPIELHPESFFDLAFGGEQEPSM
ncbi:hypothetical protein Slin15195_G061160 [Septoria linicola]|uniref:Uncharacterized protein n=1 Tax=Septoria linicola TaxID=215465 RepID=A0A9Q9AVN6_9PEZI|nr:hypothetical protein Slin14017_G076960 [Septoria linicola]USW52797.1 hypothetical protein Slin15195_G061160 [Septoria linicola]